MTISSATRKAGPFLGNGVTNTFPFTFKVFSATDLQVIKTSTTGVDSAALVLNSDYSVSLNADQNVSPGGSITYPLSGVILATNEKLTVTGVLAELQNTHITNGGNFFANNIEDQLDYITILVQQHAEKIARAALASPTDVAPILSLGTAVGRANTYPAFDSSGNLSLAKALPGGTLSQGVVAPMIHYQTSKEITASVVPTSYLFPAGHLERYGAAGDNVANDSAAITTAFSTGHVVIGTPGKTYYLGTGTITISATPARAWLYGVKWRTAVNAATCLNFACDDVQIYGLELYGRGNSAYTGNEHLVAWSGASAAAYRTGLVLKDLYLHDVGSRAIYSQFGKKAVLVNSRLENLGYAGVHVLSGLDWVVAQNEIDTIGPGTSSNAYGVSFTRDSALSDNLAISPRSKNCVAANNIIKNIPIWVALDTHAGEEITFANNIIENTTHGVLIGSCPNVAGNAAFGPKNCRSIGNQCYSTINNGYGVAISGAILVTGTIIDAAEGCSSVGDTVVGYGVSGNNTNAGIICFATQGVQIVAPHVRNSACNGICMYHDNYGFSISGGSVIDPWDNVATDCSGVRLDAGYNTGVVSGISLQRVNAGLGTTVGARGINVNSNTATTLIVGPNYNTMTLKYSGITGFTVTPITDNTAGTPSSALAVTGATYNQAYLANSLATLAAAINTIETALRNAGMMA